MELQLVYYFQAWVEFQYKPKADVGENYTPDHMAYVNTTIGAVQYSKCSVKFRYSDQNIGNYNL